MIIGMDFETICSCLPTLINWGIIVLLFIVAWLIYYIVIHAFNLYARTSAITLRVIKSCRTPFLFLLLELALFWSLSFFKFSEKIESISHSILYVIVVLTIGWFVARIARGVFHHHEARYQDIAFGSQLTQAIFLYRAALIVIILLTLASLLLIFPHIKNVGFGILGSAGVAGIAIGMAAKPVLSNLIAGFLLAFMKTVKIGDGIFIEGTFGRVESIHMTHVVVRSWDLKRIVIPVANFIEKPFQNADLVSSELIGSVFLYCDYTVPVSVIREKCSELIESHPLYTGTVWKVHLTEMEQTTMQIRIIMTGASAPDTFELRCFVREKLVDFLQREYKSALPCYRYKNFETPAEQI